MAYAYAFKGGLGDELGCGSDVGETIKRFDVTKVYLVGVGESYRAELDKMLAKHDIELVPDIDFGEFGSDGKVYLREFCPDPDGGPLPWFKGTGKTVDLDQYHAFATGNKEHSGPCTDTGEFSSHAGVLLQELMAQAPQGTNLMTFKHTYACGTRTFSEKVEATYYL